MPKTPRFWFSNSARSRLISKVLTPISWIYSFGFKVKFSNTKPKAVDVPVVCVGNVVVGGAGKTPIVLWLAAELKRLGLHPHVILRGYGGSYKTTHKVLASDTASEVGDEALLYADTYPTWVGGDRVSSAKAACDAGADIILMDDGFQNPGLAKDTSFLVIDHESKLGNGLVLPGGPLREGFSFALKRCDCILLTGEQNTASTDAATKMCRHHGFKGPIIQAITELIPLDETWLEHKKLIAFSGIGRPEKFFNTLENSNSCVVETHAFPDHHFFTQEDMNRLAGRLSHYSETLPDVKLVTTSKDFVRLSPDFKKLCKPIQIQVTVSDKDKVISKVLKHLDD